MGPRRLRSLIVFDRAPERTWEERKLGGPRAGHRLGHVTAGAITLTAVVHPTSSEGLGLLLLTTSAG